MPGALEYILDQSSREHRILEDAYAKEYTDRAKLFESRWNYYNGIMPRPLRMEQDKINDNILLPKVDQIADKSVSLLYGDGLRFDSGGDDADTEEDRRIAELWAANRQQLLLHNIGLSGAMTGHNFVRLEPRGGQPRIVALNPAHAAVFWSLEDVAEVLWYRLQYRVGRAGSGKRIDYVRGTVGNTSIVPNGDTWWELVYRSEGGDVRWIPVGEPKALPWPFPPVADWQNLPLPHSYYGQDDVSKAIVLNDNLNFLVSTYNRILKHHAAPKTIGTGFNVEALTETKIGGFFTVSEPAAKVYNLEMQSDLGAARELMAILMNEIWQSARLIDPQSFKDKIGALTNFGLRVLYTDAISKVATKRLLYAEAFEAITKRALAMMGQAVPGRVATVWPEVLPVDTAEEIKGLLEELNAGVIDRQTYREARGYDSAKIEQRLAEEREGQENLGSALLTAFARGD